MSFKFQPNILTQITYKIIFFGIGLIGQIVTDKTFSGLLVILVG
jgi:hypothetical protein